VEHYLNLIVRAIFIENMALALFLGICSFVAVSKRVPTSFGLGAAVTFVLLMTVPLNNLIYTYVLRRGALRWLSEDLTQYDLSFLQLLTFLGSIAASTQLVEMFLDRFAPALYGALGVFLPLIATNCAILGGSLFMVNRNYSLPESVAFAFGSGIGWLMAIVALSAIRERLQYSLVPAPLRGIGITFILIGIMAMGFMAFSGIRR
jgi:Na+-transporting NADH:ubiquinone oxidoreductase subunit E